MKNKPKTNKWVEEFDDLIKEDREATMKIVNREAKKLNDKK